jgi:hypothetical protein
MHTLTRHTEARRALGYASSLGAIWVVSAGLRPSTTYHLAPILIAAIFPIALIAAERRPDLRVVMGSSAAGAGVALMMTAVLTIADWLQGPSLLPYGGAVAESVTFALGGGAVGMLAGIVLRRS